MPIIATLLDIEPIQPGLGIKNATTADFFLENFTLTLAAPEDFGGPLHDYVRERGEVPYLLRLKTQDAQQTGLLHMKLAHGAQIELVE